MSDPPPVSPTPPRPASIVTPITLHFLFDVNSFMVRTGESCALIDTGLRPCRGRLEQELAAAGCDGGALQVIILTHAHADHAGNCAYLGRTYGAPIAMHSADAGKAKCGDMFWQPEGRRSASAAVAGALLSVVGLGRFDRFSPDVLLHDNQHLGAFGLDARVLHLPGHSPGSIGILTAGGDLFCGDLLTNRRRPARNSMVDNVADMAASIDRLARLDVRMVYPGHGKPFPMEALGLAAAG